MSTQEFYQNAKGLLDILYLIGLQDNLEWALIHKGEIHQANLVGLVTHWHDNNYSNDVILANLYTINFSDRSTIVKKIEQLIDEKA